MGIRTGAQFLDKINAMRPHIVIDGEVVSENVAEHPAFRDVARTYAKLFDMQHDPRYQDQLTFTSPTTGDLVNASFLVPRSVEDLKRRRVAIQAWADETNGFLGRSGDYMSSSLTALGAAQTWFAKADPKFGERIANYYEYARENDLLATHTLIPPQVNRSLTGSQQGGGQLAARIVEERPDGIVVRGARMLATVAPIADELLVFPSTVLRGTPEDAPYSYAFAIQNDAPGLRYLCRGSLHNGGSTFDEPLAARYEEMDAVVVFDDVFVPNDRVFMLGHPELCNAFYAETGAGALMTHQVVTRTVAKTEFFLGLASEIGAAIGIEGFQHIQEDLAELIVDLEIGRALLRAAEADGAINDWGVYLPRWETLNAARNWYPKVSQRFPQIIRKFSASGLMALPGEADIASDARDDIEQYLQGATVNGTDRVQLFKLAFDASISGFSSRQALYEYFFFGDPVRMAGALVNGYDRDPARERIRKLLNEGRANLPHDTCSERVATLAL
ncbi:4-hydroxyphenylacetate 3-monooxygenase, oxygenase component [Mycolicibacterium monacense]|uniref:4-hydroxyphenylacetate 3-monooxygenase oxygenase component n=2 Tax=Mycobacteriaceae TaxID=1762 RepID=A0AAD1IV74_MYCMB|nr:4-hydroxyphenylacetate 3-monooxygenase, oxygenase component [Mycolicibacterium monacense]MDA4100972.1 MFS transporter [Mycolicibacterium monacense DSM 44395]ORB19740.1 4-hydroxyphenylacetate 3-monooxygenase, oxygenase component [Mycolicibacterium monacense DSM 44395]QHP86362.1 4-hydroxyphenylacetate 3-monooxygenase, oxygenase component [Mycolicibacterium monacense DSM 44395]BBZ60615.1 4-hydroxyphenylacetate 3-monooxygenase oxygenase component [Mycolicibacterium monacense]